MPVSVGHAMPATWPSGRLIYKQGNERWIVCNKIIIHELSTRTTRPICLTTAPSCRQLPLTKHRLERALLFSTLPIVFGKSVIGARATSRQQLSARQEWMCRTSPHTDDIFCRSITCVHACVHQPKAHYTVCAALLTCCAILLAILTCRAILLGRKHGVDERISSARSLRLRSPSSFYLNACSIN